jgi:hypothetical protein
MAYPPPHAPFGNPPLPLFMTQPLPAPYHTWGPHDFSTVATYMTNLPNQSQLANPYQVCPRIPTYSNQAQRSQIIQGSVNPTDRVAAQMGTTVSSAVPFFPSQRGGVGVVCSPLNSALPSDTNDWHMVGFLRQGNTAWVYDPAYVMDSQTRLPMIPGTSNVSRLLAQPGLTAVRHVQVQGAGLAEPQCMGRSVQWVDNVNHHPHASMPYPPQTFIPGQLTPGWQWVQRT